MLYAGPRKGWNFAVVRTEGNTVKLVKLFGEDAKDEAMVYGDAYFRAHPEWCISCIRAVFDPESHKMSGMQEVFKVWRTE